IPIGRPSSSFARSAAAWGSSPSSSSERSVPEPDLRVAELVVRFVSDRVYRSVCILPGQVRTTPLRGGPSPSMKALISSDRVPAPSGPYSPGLRVGEWIFLSGQGGFDTTTGKVVSDD